MADISDLPMLHDIDADYSPQYVKLARILLRLGQSGRPELAAAWKTPIREEGAINHERPPIRGFGKFLQSWTWTMPRKMPSPFQASPYGVELKASGCRDIAGACLGLPFLAGHEGL
jgi:hypothetical protein